MNLENPGQPVAEWLRTVAPPGKASAGPSIVLVGAIHDDSEHNSIRNRLIRSALRGEIELGIEGATRENSASLTQRLSEGVPSRFVSKASLIHGIETEEAHVLTGLIKLRHMFYHDESPSVVKMLLDRMLLPLLKTYPTARLAWLEARKGSPGNALTTRHVKNPDRDTSARRKLLAQDEKLSTLTRWNEVLFAFARHYAGYTRHARSRLGHSTSDKNFSKRLESALLWDPDELVIRWRDHFLADGIVRLHQSSRQGQPPIAVIVGAGHLDGLKRILRRRLPGVAVQAVDLLNDIDD